jgi:hypothetical protein
MQPVSKQRIGKDAYNNRDIVGNGVIYSGPYKVVVRKNSVENRQSSSGVPSESWALQGRYELRKWSVNQRATA